MIVSAGSSTYAPTAYSGASAAGLEAQLARCQKELSAQVNCSSANTLEGKAAIESLSNKISVLKSRIDEMSNSQGNGPSATSEAKKSSHDNAEASVPGSSDATLGGRLDVFA